MEINISNSKKKLELADEVFACNFNEPLVHQIITAQMAGERAGTKAQKTRAEVRGGGVKPWRQKGTGQARAGTIRSPIWRKGGKVFAATPRSYKQKVNKKMYKGALRSIFSELIRQERLMLVDNFQVDDHKTKALVNKLKDMKIQGATLIVTDNLDENLYLAARNLPHVAVAGAAESTSNPVALIKTATVIITQSAIKEIEVLLK